MHIDLLQRVLLSSKFFLETLVKFTTSYYNYLIVYVTDQKEAIP